MLRWPSTTRRRNKARITTHKQASYRLLQKPGISSQGHRWANICVSCKPKPRNCLVSFTPQMCTDAKRDWSKRRWRHKGRDGYTGRTRSHSLWYPQTPAAPFQLALRGSSGLPALHSECETCWAGSAGLHPSSGGSVSPRRLLNLTGSQGWALGSISALTQKHPHHL